MQTLKYGFIRLLLFLLFVVGAQCWAPGSVASCPPGPEPNCPQNPASDFDNLFNHPSDCGYFIHCDAGGKPICKQCAPGLHFSSSLRVCDWPQNAKCVSGGENPTTEPPPAQTPEPSTEAPEPPTEPPAETEPPPAGTAPPEECSDNPELACPICDCDGVKHPHPYECEWYYECKDGNPVLTQCKDGLYFNPSKGICDYPCFAGCAKQ